MCVVSTLCFAAASWRKGYARVYLPVSRSTARKTITLMFSSDYVEMLSDGTYTDLNGSIQNYQSPESGTKRDRTPQFVLSHLCEHQLKIGS